MLACIAGCFHLYLKILWRYYWKNYSDNNFQQIQIKGGRHKYNFSLVMHEWGVFPDNKRCSMQKKNVQNWSVSSKQTWLPALSQIRSFEYHFGCDFGCTKSCTFESYEYSMRILWWLFQVNIKLRVLR